MNTIDSGKGQEIDDPASVLVGGLVLAHDPRTDPAAFGDRQIRLVSGATDAGNLVRFDSASISATTGHYLRPDEILGPPATGRPACDSTGRLCEERSR